MPDTTYLDWPFFDDAHPINPATGAGAGGYHSLLITKEGRLLTLGLNDLGQLGRPDNFASSLPNATPAPVAGLSDVVLAAGGASHSLVLRRNGTVWSFGSNAFGQLGRTTLGPFTDQQHVSRFTHHEPGK